MKITWREQKKEYQFSNSWDESIITKNVWEKVVKVVISFDTLERDWLAALKIH